MERAHLHGGRFFVGGPRYGYPLWFYNGYWYPWWIAYRVGLMDAVLYNAYVTKYGTPPTASSTAATDPAQLGPEGSVTIDACIVCNTIGSEIMYVCGGCMQTVYCSDVCQAIDWHQHKEHC